MIRNLLLRVNHLSNSLLVLHYTKGTRDVRKVMCGALTSQVFAEIDWWKHPMIAFIGIALLIGSRCLHCLDFARVVSRVLVLNRRVLGRRGRSIHQRLWGHIFFMLIKRCWRSECLGFSLFMYDCESPTWSIVMLHILVSLIIVIAALCVLLWLSGAGLLL